MDILLLLCLLAGELWSFLFSLLVVKRVMPRTIGKLVGCWQEKFGWSESSKILRSVTLCLMWKIWNGIIVGLLKLDFLPL